MQEILQNNFSERRIQNFYSNFQIKNPFYIALLTIITCGFYGISFLYEMNKEFEQHDETAPDSQRCLYIILYLPTIWIFLNFLHEYLLGGDVMFLSLLLGAAGFFLVFLILLYTYDFCKTYAEYTQSSTMFWYSGFFPTYLTITMISIGYYIWAVFFFLVSVSIFLSMQSELNRRYREFTIFIGRRKFISIERASS